MTVYLFLALILASALIKPKNICNTYIIMFLLCFFGFFRGEYVGDDVLIYCKNIERTTFSPSTWSYFTTFEAGYNILIAIYNLFFAKPLFFIGLCNIFFVVAFYKYAKNKTAMIAMAFFLMYMMGYYLMSYNIIRQFFAISLCLLAFCKVDFEQMTRKQACYLGCYVFFVAVFFHNTALCFFAYYLYYFLRKKVINNYLFFSIVLLTSIVIYKLDLISQLLGALNIFFFNEKTTAYLLAATTGATEEVGYSFLRILLDSSFIIFLLYKLKKVNAYLFLMIAGQIFVNIFGALNPLFARVPTLLFVIAIPQICEVWKIDKISKSVIGIYSILLFSNFLSKNYAGVIPYTFM